MRRPREERLKGPAALAPCAVGRSRPERLPQLAEQRDDHFQLLAGTNQDLSGSVREGRFREDLFARLNLWTFNLPALKDRKEDIEPNLEFELRRYGEREGQNVTFNKEARDAYLRFAAAPEATWRANFRDLSASVTRMATLAPQGRINEETVRDEIARLRQLWSGSYDDDTGAVIADHIGADRLETIDLFDRVQLATVITVCRRTSSLSAAGRELFAASRLDKSSSNDADRLRKYLARFGLTFASVARS